MPTQKNLGNLDTKQVDNFVAQQKRFATNIFKLNVSDPVLDICYLEYTKAVKKEN